MVRRRPVGVVVVRAPAVAVAPRGADVAAQVAAAAAQAADVVAQVAAVTVAAAMAAVARSRTARAAISSRT